MTEEAMLLQPEGPVNAEARLLSGDILASKQDYNAAAKAYITVAVLNDDDLLAKKALTRAAEAYRKAGNETEAQKTLEELRNRSAHVPVSPTPKP
jgi:TolA-binding protein